ncbi:MAG: hypothetical protein GXP59_03880 [Deltaproteobacteria bacterium]|nr:hypothetical protein [Deltaproteobacteria bacterium]
MMPGKRSDNGAMALRDLERQTARLPLVRVKILNKFRGLIGLCLLADSGNPDSSEALRRKFIGLCGKIGLRCSCPEPFGASDGNNGASYRPGVTADVLPSCQVSVEEKMQLFSFLRKG